MNTLFSRIIFSSLVLLIVGLGCWWLFSKPPAASALVEGTSQTTFGVEAKSSLQKASTQNITKQLPLPYQTSTYNDFISSRDFFALYNSLGGRADAEAKFFRATILERCLGYGKTYKGESADLRLKRNLASVTGQYAQQRRDIYTEWGVYSAQVVCSGFTDAITEADVKKAYAEAAAAGDPRAKLNSLSNDVMDAAKQQTQKIIGLPFGGDGNIQFVEPTAPTEAQVSALKQALASKDPAQIMFAGPLLTGQYAEYELKFGDGKGRVGILDTNLWQSVACYYGGGCDNNSIVVKLDCALHARCDVGSFDDLAQKYYVKADDWPRFLEYRATLIRAIEEQNWALLMESRGPRTNTYGHLFNAKPPNPRFVIRL